MKSLSAALRPAALALSLLLVSTSAPAQEPAPRPLYAQPEQPWLYVGSDIPRDEQWLFGELPNGLRYAARENGVPPGQVSIRIRIDAGALHERDNELGFAHLLEHLTFRESKYLASGTAIATWQRLGATFGNDTNAETTSTHTLYKLDLPEAAPAKLEESLKLLSGMIREPALSRDNLSADVPIVLAERRDSGGAARRIGDARREVYFAGQLLAKRPIIGTLETLQGATPRAVRAFHNRWYRPENTVISIVGDVDRETLAALVERYFGDWKVNGALPGQPDFGAPVTPRGADPANPVGEVRVLVEPELPRTLSYVVRRPWTQVVDNIEFNRQRLISNIALAIVQRRLEARARTGASYYSASIVRDDISRSTDATVVGINPIGDDWRAALHDVRAVLADALATPPSEEEIAREVAEVDGIFASVAEQSRLQSSGDLADQVAGAVDIRETIASPEAILDIYRGMRDRFTPQAVFDATRHLLSGTVVNSVLLVPGTDEASEAQLRAALLQEVVPDTSSRIAPRDISFAELPPIGTPGTILHEGSLGVPEIQAMAFDNGVRAAVWQTKTEPGRATVLVRFGDGFRAFAPEDAPYIELGQSALLSAGIGDLGQEDLDRLSTGRLLNAQFDVSEGAFLFLSFTRPADVDDQLYLLAAKLDHPRWDAAPILRAKAGSELSYDSFSSSPSSVLGRDLPWLTHSRDPRFKTVEPAEMKRATPEGFRKVWEPILASGPVEVMVFGDIDPLAVKAALARTFGALKPRPIRGEHADSPFPGVPVGQNGPQVLYHRGDADQAAAAIAWPTGGGPDGLPESRQIEILAEIFSNRILEAMREKAGASYSPAVSADWPTDVPDGGKIMAVAQLPPAAVPTFFEVAEEISADLIANGPSADEVQRATEPLRQWIDRSSSGHFFYMVQLSGATFEPRYIDHLWTLHADYSETTPERMQQLAAKYLAPGRAFRVEVLPQALEAKGQAADAAVSRAVGR